MDDISLIIYNSINERAKLLGDADLLEVQARSLREKAKVNDLNFEINRLHNEIFRLLDKFLLLNNLITLISKLFNDDDGQISISLETYKTCSFQGRTIEVIENELVDVTTRIVFYMDLLSQLCDYVGHNYMFVRKDSTFDFGGMELTFEEKEIHYCTICGNAIHTDLNGEKVLESSQLDILQKLRKARNISIYESKFNIIGKLQL